MIRCPDHNCFAYVIGVAGSDISLGEFHIATGLSVKTVNSAGIHVATFDNMDESRP